MAELIQASDGSTAANLDQLDFSEEAVQSVDSLVAAFIKRKELFPDMENRKVILNACLAYRNSEELDDVAVRNFRHLVKKMK